MSQTTIEGLYPLLIIGAGALIRFLKKRAKEQKERQKPPLFAPPSAPVIREEKIAPLKVQSVVSSPPREDCSSFYRKKKPRIAKVISGLKRKQDLILLSEILVNKHQVK